MPIYISSNVTSIFPLYEISDEFKSPFFVISKEIEFPPAEFISIVSSFCVFDILIVLVFDGFDIAISTLTNFLS
jgi:hypothetical protein